MFTVTKSDLTQIVVDIPAGRLSMLREVKASDRPIVVRYLDQSVDLAIGESAEVVDGRLVKLAKD